MNIKDIYQKRAEEIANEMYDCGFHDLTETIKAVVYDEAVQDVTDKHYEAFFIHSLWR